MTASSSYSSEKKGFQSVVCRISSNCQRLSLKSKMADCGSLFLSMSSLRQIETNKLCVLYWSRPTINLPMGGFWENPIRTKPALTRTALRTSRFCEADHFLWKNPFPSFFIPVFLTRVLDALSYSEESILVSFLTPFIMFFLHRSISL